MVIIARKSKPRASPWEKPNVRSAVTFVIGTAATWAISLLDPTGLLFLMIVPTLTIRWLCQRRWIAAACYFTLLPTTVSAIEAVVDYRDGDAQFQSFGLPGTRFGNQNPTYRCGHSTGGCVVSGNEWIRLLPYNLTLAAMIRTFGDMPGSYDGPYPSEDEAKDAVAKGSPIAWEYRRDGKVMVGDVETRLDTEVAECFGQGIARPTVHTRIDDDIVERQPRPVTGAIWQERCLILSFPMESFDSKPESAVIIVVDRHNGRPFAYYPVGDYSHHFPPVAWRNEKRREQR